MLAKADCGNPDAGGKSKPELIECVAFSAVMVMHAMAVQEAMQQLCSG